MTKLMKPVCLMVAMALVLSLVGVVLPASEAQAASVQKSPLATYDTFSPWNSPTRAYTNDDSKTSGAHGDLQYYYNYGFSIPAGSTIDGIEVLLDDAYYGMGATDGTIKVEVSWGNFATGNISPTKVQALASSADNYTLGGPTDNWTHAWTVGEIANFQVRVFAETTPTTTGLCYLDWLPVTVYYTSPPAPPPTVTSVAPNSGDQGQTLNVTITGDNFTGASAVSFGAGITVSHTVDSATQISANITIAADATLGTRDVSVTTPGGTDTLTAGFTVTAPPPTVTSVAPDSGHQGQTLDVTITGTYFTGATAVSFGAGITVGSHTVDNATQITANITIAADATLGTRDVSVTTSGGTGTLTAGFTVTTPYEYDSLFFTVADVVFFSYYDGTLLELYDSTGTLIWNNGGAPLNKGGHAVVSVAQGVYRASGSKKFAVLTGDPITRYVVGYYAMDQDGYGASTELYTWVPRLYGHCEFIVFAYQDGTDVTVEYTDTGVDIATFTLNRGEHWCIATLDTEWLHVTANKPVSALTCYDQGYFVPSANRKFSGTEFYTYVNDLWGWPQDLTVIAYNDGTSVTITDTGTATVIWTGTLDSGQAHVEGYPYGADKYFKIESSDIVTVSVQPWVSSTSLYSQGAYVQDRDGSGIGTDLIGSTQNGGYLYIMAYYDGTTVEVYNSQTGTLVSTHALDSGEYVEANPGNGLWRIRSNEYVCAYSGCGTWNADFAPVEFGEAVEEVVEEEELVADFSGSPRSGLSPLSVQFTDLSTGNPTSWRWSFGDGETSKRQNPSHTYYTPGIYTVSLRVTGSPVTDTETKPEYITVLAPRRPEEKRPPLIAPAMLSVHNLTVTPPGGPALTALVTPAEVYPNQAVTINAEVVNKGDMWGSKQVELMINGQVEQRVRVDVSAHSSQPVSFTVYRTEPGVYSIYVEGVTAYFTVLYPETRGAIPFGTGGIIALVVIGIMLIIGVILAFVIRPT